LGSKTNVKQGLRKKSARRLLPPLGHVTREDVLDVTTIRGRYVLPILGIAIVLELDRAKGRVTETIGGKLPIYYNCEPPSATL